MLSTISWTKYKLFHCSLPQTPRRSLEGKKANAFSQKRNDVIVLNFKKISIDTYIENVIFRDKVDSLVMNLSLPEKND